MTQQHNFDTAKHVLVIGLLTLGAVWAAQYFTNSQTLFADMFHHGAHLILIIPIVIGAYLHLKHPRIYIHGNHWIQLIGGIIAIFFLTHALFDVFWSLDENYHQYIAGTAPVVSGGVMIIWSIFIGIGSAVQAYLLHKITANHTCVLPCHDGTKYHLIFDSFKNILGGVLILVLKDPSVDIIFTGITFVLLIVFLARIGKSLFLLIEKEFKLA